MGMPIPYCIYNGIFSHISLYQYCNGKLLIYFTVPFKKKSKNESLSAVLQYYRLRKSLTRGTDLEQKSDYKTCGSCLIPDIKFTHAGFCLI